MQDKRVGILGLGPQGVAHLKFVEALGDADVVAVCDESTAVSFRFLNDGNDRFTDHLYQNLPEMLAKAQLDILVMATPWRYRCPGIKLALEAGCHVMVENPLAMTADECAAIMGLAEAHPSLRVCVNEQWRWLPSVLCVKGRLTGLNYGRLKAVRLAGKGRDANVELPRIVTHLLSILQDDMVALFESAYVNWLNAQSMVASLMTPEGILVELDLLKRAASDVRNCSLELVYQSGRVRLQGGFLETVNHVAAGVAAGRELTVGIQEWSSLAVPEVWQIQPGQDMRALTDPVMNPTFGLWEQFMAAVLSQDSNPFPPGDFMPVCQTLDLLAQAKDAGGFATTIW